MKTKTLIFVLLLSCFSPLFIYSQTGDFRFNIAFGAPSLDLRVGVEYQFNDYLGIAANIGTTMLIFIGFNEITYDITPVIYLTKKTLGLPIETDIVVGITDGVIVFTTPVAYMWNLGATLRSAFLINEKISIGSSLGVGYPLFYKDNHFSAGSNIPLGIWPHLEIFGQYAF